MGTELSTENPECFHERIFNSKLRAAELRQSSSPVNKQFYHLPPENFSEAYGIFNRDVMERGPPRRSPLPKRHSGNGDTISPGLQMTGMKPQMLFLMPQVLTHCRNPV